MLKLDELSNPKSCINKAADDEPVFVLRAQDWLFADALQFWIDRAQADGVNPAKIAEADGLLIQALEWQATHEVKRPD